MTREIDRQQVTADFMSQIAVNRANPEGMEADLSMAIGVLLGQGFPGCAAAVAVLAQNHTGINLDAYIGPKS